MVFWWGPCCSLICFLFCWFPFCLQSTLLPVSLDCPFLIATSFTTHIGVISHLHTENMVNCFVIEVYVVSATYGRTGKISRQKRENHITMTQCDLYMSTFYVCINNLLYALLVSFNMLCCSVRRGRDHMLVWFTATYATNAHHH